MRIVGAIHVSPTGNVTQSEDVIPTKVGSDAGQALAEADAGDNPDIGEYALVEILSPSDISQSVWDFRVDPRTGG